MRIAHSSRGGVALALSAVMAVPAPAGLPARAEDWFKWGEYDSLIAVLDPWTADTAEAAEDRARGFLFLGVAFHATEARTLSDSAFCMAGRLDSTVALDPFYVLPEILDHFRAVAAECRDRRSARAGGSLQLAGQEARASATAHDGTAAPEPGTPGNRKTLWWSLGGGLAAAAVTGGIFLWLQRDRDPIDSVVVIDGR